MRIVQCLAGAETAGEGETDRVIFDPERLSTRMSVMSFSARISLILTLPATAALLCACGGGGGSAPAGAPSQRWRIASTMIVKGLTSANSRSPDGIELTGTKAEEMNVSGKTAMKPTELTDSGEFRSRPMKATAQT